MVGAKPRGAWAAKIWAPRSLGHNNPSGCSPQRRFSRHYRAGLRPPVIASPYCKKRALASSWGEAQRASVREEGLDPATLTSNQVRGRCFGEVLGSPGAPGSLRL
jgi:hypothetical protein